MTRKHHRPVDTMSAAEILRQAPPAKRAALIRAAEGEIVTLLESTHNAVGFPKDGDKWNSMVCLDLESVRQRFLNPVSRQEEVHAVPA